jgi:hypothetical protein
MPDQSWTPIANIGLHALARRIERGAERDHAALVRGLSVLVQADEGSAWVNTQRRLLAAQCDGGAERLRQAEHSAARCEDMAGQLTANGTVARSNPKRGLAKAHCENDMALASSPRPIA